MFLPSNITLKFGDTGDFVAELQRRLANVKAYPEDQVNGFFDGTTVNGVSAFQTRCGIRADGIAGPDTLRRLNAAITGTSSTEESSGGSSNQEEDAKAAAANMARGFYVMDNQLAGAPAPMDIHGNTHGQPAPQGWGGHEAQAAPAAMSEQQLVQQQLMREAQQQQPHGMSPDQVAQNLQQQAQMQQQMLAQQQQQLQQQLLQQQAPQQLQPPQPDPLQQQAQVQQQMLAQQQQQFGQQAQQPQPLQQQAATPQAEPAKGLMGRAMEKMDALVQRLANYFEAKLPPDVLRDVKNIGHTMLQSGVKESAIPSGPEQARAQQLPTRGPDQSQTPQRG